MFSDELVQELQINAVEWVRTLGRTIEGGGGGQAFFATAGGKNPQGLSEALKQAETLISKIN
jgi:alanyl-tRNA synthetase